MTALPRASSRALLFLFLYTVAAIALTYPLILQFGDHVPGTAQWSMDEYGYLWNHWWFKFALFDRGTNPFTTNFLFYPLGTSLVLYTYTLLHVALAIPLHFAFGLVPGINATVIFSFAISAFGMYLFVTYLLRVSFKIWLAKRLVDGQTDPNSSSALIQLSAFIAGMLFAFSSNRFVYVSLGHYNIIATEWIPFYLLFLIKTLLNQDSRYPVLAGLFAAFAMYSETTDGVLLALLTLVILVFEYRILNTGVLVRVAIIGMVAGILFAPLLIPTLNEILFSGYQLPNWGHSEKLLIDLAGFLTPTSLSPFARNWEQELDLVRQGISRFSDVNTFFVGYATLAIALIGGVRYFRTLKMWIAIVITFALLSLGPLLHLNGVSEFDLDGLTVTFPMPFLALHYVPILRENRVPNRYSILTMLALAVLVAYGVYWGSSRIKRLSSQITRRVLLTASSVLIFILLVGEHSAIPLPLTDARIPDIYNQIRNEQGDFAVLTLPLGWRNSFGQTGAEDTRTQYYQSASQKYSLNGQIQRNPDSLFDYFSRLPVLKSLAALETYKDVSEQDRAEDHRVAPSLISFFGIRYVIVNPAVPNRPPYSDNRARIIEYIEQVLPLGEKVYDKDGVVAWKVIQPTNVIPTIEADFGTHEAAIYHGDGWSDDDQVSGISANWVTAKAARVFFPVYAGKSLAVTIRALPFSFPDAPRQSISLIANGHFIAETDLPEGWSEVNFQVPALAIHTGLNEFILQPKYVSRPRDVVPPHFEVGSTGISSPIDLLVQSTPEFGSIKINGKEVSMLKRGYNLAVIDPKSGSFQVRNFDTGGSIVESRSLTDFISKLPNGAIVAGSSQEEAGTNLGDRAVAALKSLGLVTDLRTNPDSTHAFVGVKGSPPGSAAEKSGRDDSIVSVGHAADDRTLAFAVDWIRIEEK